MIILKVTKNQGLTLSSEDTFLEKISGGIKFPPSSPSTVLGSNCHKG